MPLNDNFFFFLFLLFLSSLNHSQLSTDKTEITMTKILTLPLFIFFLYSLPSAQNTQKKNKKPGSTLHSYITMAVSCINMIQRCGGEDNVLMCIQEGCLFCRLCLTFITALIKNRFSPHCCTKDTHTAQIQKRQAEITRSECCKHIAYVKLKLCWWLSTQSLILNSVSLHKCPAG